MRSIWVVLLQILFQHKSILTLCFSKTDFTSSVQTIDFEEGAWLCSPLSIHAQQNVGVYNYINNFGKSLKCVVLDAVYRNAIVIKRSFGHL